MMDAPKPKKQADRLWSAGNNQDNACRRWTLGIVGVLISAYLLSRVAIFEGLTSIITDEAQYREFILNLQTPYLLNPLFINLFRLTSKLDEHWYLGARLVNAGILLLGLGGLWQLTISLRLRFWKKVTVIIAGTCCGITTYALNLMPEAMLSASIWWSVVLLLKPWSLGLYGKPILLGGAIGLCALIKPHAIILLPAFCAATLDHSGASSLKRWLGSAKTLLIVIGSFAVVRWGLGTVLAGVTAQGIFGGRYEELGSPLNTGMLGTALWVGSRHTIALLMLIPGTAIAPLMVWRSIRQEHNHEKEITTTIRLGRFLLIALVCSIGAYSLFTAKVANASNLQEHRIHIRYYFYLLPLVVAWLMTTSWPKHYSWRSWSTIVLCAASLVCGSIFLIPHFAPQPSWVEAPPLAVSRSTSIAAFLVIIGSSLIAFKTRPSILGLYSTLLLVASEAIQLGDSYRAMATTKPLRNAEQQLRFLSRYNSRRSPYVILLGKDESGIGTVSRRAAMQRCMGINFWDRQASYINICKKDDYSSSPLFMSFSDSTAVRDKDQACWDGLLALDGHPVNKLHVWKRAERLSIRSDDNGDSRSLLWGDLSTYGFHKAESGGIWSNNLHAIIQTPWPLPEATKLILEARSHNTVRLLNITIGNSAKTITITPAWQRFSLSFANDKCHSAITFSKEGSLSRDAGRFIGFALRKVEVQTGP